MITADQLVLHLIGDYVIQSNWMAQKKTTAWWPASAHALSYALPFLVLNPSGFAMFVIVLTHAIIDHYRLARYICYVKNFLSPNTPQWWHPWSECSGNGYPKSMPDWLSY